MSAVLTRPWRKSLHHRKTAVRDIHSVPYTHSTVNVGSTNTFCRQKLDYCALSLCGGIHGKIVNCYLASASVNNTLPLLSVYQISPAIHYRGNRKVVPLGITALQPQSHFHLGTPYTCILCNRSQGISAHHFACHSMFTFNVFRRRMYELHMVMWSDSTILCRWTLHC
jgi:hypothetical protein